MTTEEILLEILEKLKIEDNTFQQSLVMGESIRAAIGLTVAVVVGIAILVLFSKFNKSFDIKQNLTELFTKLRTYNRTETKPANTTEKEFPEDPYKQTFKELIDFIKRTTTLRYFFSILAVWFEISIIFSCINIIVTKTILLVNCFYAPEKVLLDYLATLF